MLRRLQGEVAGARDAAARELHEAHGKAAAVVAAAGRAQADADALRETLVVERREREVIEVTRTQLEVRLVALQHAAAQPHADVAALQRALAASRADVAAREGDIHHLQQHIREIERLRDSDAHLFEERVRESERLRESDARHLGDSIASLQASLAEARTHNARLERAAQQAETLAMVVDQLSHLRDVVAGTLRDHAVAVALLSSSIRSVCALAGVTDTPVSPPRRPAASPAAPAHSPGAALAATKSGVEALKVELAELTGVVAQGTAMLGTAGATLRAMVSQQR